MVLDLLSLQVVAALGSLLSGTIYLLPGVVSNDRENWARWWGAGKLMMGASNGAVLVYRGPNPLAAEGWSHLGLILGLGACVHGIACFAGRRMARSLLVALGLCTLGAAAIIVLRPHDVRWAMGCIGGARGLALGAIAVIALGVARRERLRTGWVMVALFTAGAAVFGARAVVLVLGETFGWSGTIRPIAAWMVAIGIVTLTLSHFSLLLMDAERSQQLLREQACRDSLTGAFNRFGLSRVTQGLRGVVSVLLIDVDRFKALNDGQGHAAGDAVLRMLSNVAQRELGEAGTLVRIGGDEFLCVLPGATRGTALDIGRRLSDRFDRALRVLIDGPDYPTLSIGVGHGRIEDGFERLTHDADEAMYAMKDLHHQDQPAAVRTRAPVAA